MATAEISSQDTFVDENVGMSTEPIQSDAADGTTDNLVPAETGGKRGAAAPAKRRVVEQEVGSPWWFTLSLCLTSVIAIMAFIVVLGASDLNVTGRTTSETAHKIASWFAEKQ